jgi:signal peptidase
MALAYIPVTRLLSLFPLTTGGTIPFTINRLFPLLAESAVLTTLAYVGGAILPIIYMSLVKAYVFVMPVLPIQQGHVKPLAYMLMSLLQLALLWVMRSKRLSLKEAYSSILNKRAGALKRIFHVVVAILNIAIAGGILFLLVSGGRLTVVTSGSMTPTLNVGDVVLVTPTQELQNGTIAVYMGERSLVIHRVVGIVHDNGTKLYIFKGDANNDVDPNPVPQKYIVGKMTFRVPLVGLPVILLTKSVGGFPTMSALLISLTVLLYTLVLQSEVIKLW